jgi:hypothetical protein
MNISWLWALIEIEGVICLIFTLAPGTLGAEVITPVLGPFRLAAAGLTFLLLVLFGWQLMRSVKATGNTKSEIHFPFDLSKQGSNFIFLAVLACITVFGAAGFVLFSLPGMADRFGVLSGMFDHFRFFIAWLALASLEIAILLLASSRKRIQLNWRIGRWYFLGTIAFLLLLTVGIGFALSLILSLLTFYRIIAAYFFSIFALAMILILVWCRTGVKYAGTEKWEKAQKYPRLLLIFLAAFLVYGLTAVLVGNTHTPSKSYFDQLAYAFLDGKIFLENPSSFTDLTLYNGKWYVAFPPLAAVFMVPLALIFGNYGVNTVLFTIFFAAINVALMFDMLNALSERGWTKLKPKENLWLTILFALGTIHWYMSIVGKVWFISRILALTFMLLAALMAFRRKSPWLIGLAVGLSLLARPNMIFIWPFLLAVYWQGLNDDHQFSFRKLLNWVLANAVPICAAVAGLLYYNWLRFDNVFDFGYAAMNVSAESGVPQYGQFNLSFIPRNLYYMWLSLPLISESCKQRLIPNVQGISILLTTPPIIYIFRAFKKKVWVIGAWAALLLQILLLSTHTGVAWEFGYRFLMDFIIPLMALIALGAGERVSRLLRGLIIAGIIVNLWGVLWYFGIWCPA